MLRIESLNVRNRLKFILYNYPSTWRCLQLQTLDKLSHRSFVSYTRSSVLKHFDDKINRRLDLNQYNPIGILTCMIRDFFKKQTGFSFQYIPVDASSVTIQDNFDELQVPLDHISRDPKDTYYLSDDYIRDYESLKGTEYKHLIGSLTDDEYTREFIDRIATDLKHSTHQLLPTHSTAHLPALLRKGITGAIYSGQVFRRDEIDSQHYPVFHQLDGYLLFTSRDIAPTGVNASHASAMDDTIAGISVVESGDTELRGSKERVAGQDDTTVSTWQRLQLAHLKDTLESLVKHLFSFADVGLESRWEDTSFPFTSPSLELYVKHGNKWVEVLGCGVLKDVIIRNNYGGDDVICGGWAFGIGLERLAMVLCNITDIRQFWDRDERFHKQYKNAYKDGKLPKFQKFSRNPPVVRDISFYLLENFGEISGSLAEEPKVGTGITRGPTKTFNENLMFDIIKSLGGEYVEDIELVSEYFHPEKKLNSLCYRITYRAFENITNDFVNKIHKNIENELGQTFNLQIR